MLLTLPRSESVCGTYKCDGRGPIERNTLRGHGRNRVCGPKPQPCRQHEDPHHGLRTARWGRPAAIREQSLDQRLGGRRYRLPGILSNSPKVYAATGLVALLTDERRR